MTQDIRWKQRFQNYKKALKQFQDGLKVKNPDILQKQGLIQCFEYTFELAWKMLQDYMTLEKGYTDKGPKPTLERAFQDDIVTDGVTWMDMLKSRNLTSHLYDEKETEKIYQKVANDYLKPFEELQKFFEDQP